MQDAFGIVIWVVVIVAAIVAVVAFAFSSGAYDQIGKGGLFTDEAPTRPDAAPVSAAVRDDEIRQMLVARNARRERRGEPPLDVEAELAVLTRPAVDPGLADEIRELVVARNARRVRQGREPLDVEAEIARRITEFEGP